MSFLDKITNYFLSAYSNSSKYRSSTIALLRIWFERNNKFKSIVSSFGTVFRNSKWSDLKVSNIKESHLISFSRVVLFIIVLLFIRLEASGLENSALIRLPIIGRWVETLYCWYWVVFGEIQYYIFTTYLMFQTMYIWVINSVSRKVSDNFYGEVINPIMPKLARHKQATQDILELRGSMARRINKKSPSNPLDLAKHTTSSNSWKNHATLFHIVPTVSDSVLIQADTIARLVPTLKLSMASPNGHSDLLLNTQLRFLEFATSSPIKSPHEQTQLVTNLEQSYLMREKSLFVPEHYQKLGNLARLSTSFNFQLNASRLSQMNKVNPSLVPTAMNTSALLNLAKQDRWLLRNSVLSEGLARNNSSFTQSKRLLGNAISNSELSVGSIWSSTQLSKASALKSAKLGKGLNTNFFSDDILKLARSAQTINLVNSTPAANFNFFEESRSWTAKKYYFTSTLYSNTYTVAATAKKLETPQTLATLSDKHFTILLNSATVNLPVALGQIHIILVKPSDLYDVNHKINHLQSKLILADLDVLSGTNLDFIEVMTSSTSAGGQLTHYTQIDQNFFDVQNVEVKL